MDGIIIIDKPAGWTSHDVVARVRRLVRERRVGHTGTLDPFATGVLVLLLGRATRLAQFLSSDEKEYEATVRLGYRTDTGDFTGTPRGPLSEIQDCSSLSDEKIEKAIESLRGEIEQAPPMYSAKKVKGQKLYEMARRGAAIEREAVRVMIRQFESVRSRTGHILELNKDGTCDLRVRVVCSAGTYIRVLAESLGERLDVGAHLSALRRTRAGEFRTHAAVKLDQLEAMSESGDAATKFILSPDSALSQMASVHLKSEETRRILHGARVRVDALRFQLKDGERVRLYDEKGVLIAIGSYEESMRQIQPRVMLASTEK